MSKLVSRVNIPELRNTIMFCDLSYYAQIEMMEWLGIQSPQEKRFDVIPIAYLHSSMNIDSQELLDYEALSQQGYYS